MKATAIILVQNEEEFITNCLDGIYEGFDEIIILSDLTRSFSGELITPDSTVELIKKYPDPKRKIIKLLDSFYDSRLDPIQNETKQRNYAREFSMIKPDIFYIIDADEIWKPELLRKSLQHIESIYDLEYNRFRIKCLLLFRKLYNGEVLAVAEKNRRHFLFQKMTVAFKPELKNYGGRMLEGNVITYDIPLEHGLFEHHSHIKTEKRMYEKLKYWGHSHHKTEKEFEKWFKHKWLCADLDTRNVDIFNPQSQPRLRKYDPWMLDEIIRTNNNIPVDEETVGFFRRTTQKKKNFFFF